MGTLELMVSPVVVDWWCVLPLCASLTPLPLLTATWLFTSAYLFTISLLLAARDTAPCTQSSHPIHCRRREHGRRWGPSFAGAFFGAGWWFFVDSVAVSSSHIPFSQVPGGKSRSVWC